MTFRSRCFGCLASRLYSIRRFRLVGTRVLFSLDSGVVLPVSPLGFSCGSFLDFEGASGEFDGEEPSPLPLLLELARIFKTELSTLESVDSGGWSAEDNEPWNGVDGLGRRFKGTSLIRDSSF